MKEIIKKFTPTFLLNFYHFTLAFFGAFFYDFPSQNLKVIGVTGTNGKTTVVEMITKILEEANYKVASLDSIKFKIGDKEWLNELRMTMPGRFFIQSFLRKAVNAGCQYAVLEITSEGIKQYRHKFINFNVAVFTNLNPEHIEAHGGFENYRAAKGKLFQATKETHVLNLDDENLEYFLKFPAKEKIGFTTSKMMSNFPLIKAENIKVSDSGLKFSVRKEEFNLKVLGEFNVCNALAAISVAFSQEINPKISKTALEKIEGIPGRMEKVISEPFKVFVDYAFTPNSLEKVYQTLTINYKRPTTKLICVLGAAGGGRDRWKRPVLGKLAARYCDEVIVTNEDPYDENPLEIIDQITVGAGEKSRKILERREAIREALRIALPEDTIIITGKGSEPSICLAHGKKIPWDDRKVVKEEFRKIYEKI